MKTDILEQIGLSKNEIKVYFALLELGPATATPIVKQAKIPNSKVYPTLQKLIQKGLVSYIIKNNVHKYTAADPSNIIELLNRKEEQISDQKKQINELIPQILLRRKLAKEKQDATVYEGMKGIQSVYQDVLDSLKKGDEYYVFNLGEKDNYEKAKLFFRNYHLKREQKGIKVKMITDLKVKNIVLEVFKGLKYCEHRFIDEPMPSSTVIYANKTATVLLGAKPTAFVVESEQNYEQYKRFFISVWNKADP
ncbi:MAG: helix-turn-helix domain-containing protein [Nanoarchaeota archaeon]|nr:helix-turn-helix domain-containing protein [Nanoarchaeota archaeon]MBU1704472.1 helix-turn-helix domain-containing protein [Nanoarchaeota archaeon]